MSEGYWRWNVDPVWENFSSLCQEMHLAKTAKNEFRRYHHTKAALYFGIGCIESFLNKAMRRYMTDKGDDDAKIVKTLKQTRFHDKLNKWPIQLCLKEFSQNEDLSAVINFYNEVRNEVTHPKAKDHSIYQNLDKLEFTDIQTTVAEYLVSFHEARNEIFPYWLFGVNFVGTNGDYKWPSLSNNIQFLYSLQWMGINIPSITYESEEWLKHCMAV